jgi:hypothetical protein
MKSNVVYLNAWLDCPDDVLRRNYAMQDRMNEAKAKFWYDMNEQRIEPWQQQMCYHRFVHANRDRIKLVVSLDTF